MTSRHSAFHLALRRLARRPAQTLSIVLTLAAAIGATTAVLSFVYGILLRPLPFPGSERLVAVCETHASVERYCVASPPNVADFAARSRRLEALGLGREWSYSLSIEGRRSGVTAGLATPGLFAALGVRPLHGRLIAEGDLAPGARKVVILGHGLWRSAFGGDPGAVGRSLTLDGVGHEIVGVLPEQARVPHLEFTRLWLPLPFDPSDEGNRRWRGFRTYGRLVAGASPEELAGELAAIQRGLADEHPETNAGWGVAVRPLRDSLTAGARPMLTLFLAAAGLVLAIAVANAANLTLARALDRRRELAVRRALGASSRDVAELVLAESLVTGAVAGVLGVGLAYALRALFVALAPAGVPRLEDVRIDAPVLASALLLSLLAGCATGWLAALRGARAEIREALGSGGAVSGPRTRLRRSLVTAQIGLAVVLLACGGLLLRSFVARLAWEPGFAREGLAVFWTSASSERFQRGSELPSFYASVLETVRSLPGVRGASLASAGPLFGGVETTTLSLEGAPAPSPETRPVARWFDVGPGYFGVLGLPLRAGREFGERDTAGSPAVAMVNETLARRLFPGESPLGRRLRVEARGEQALEIVGVVADSRPLTPGLPPEPELYWPFAQAPRWAAFVVLRTTADARASEAALRQRLDALGPAFDAGRLSTLDDLVERRLVEPRFVMALVSAFGLLALLLAGGGVFAVTAYAVVQRTREIGIRLALGAPAGRVLGLFVAEGLRDGLLGVALGLPAALGVTRLLGSLVPGASPGDPLAHAGAAGLLLGLALLSAFLAARRVSGVDPLLVLRSE